MNMKFNQVACGQDDTIFIEDNGQEWGCDYNLFGNLEIGNREKTEEPVPIMKDKKFTSKFRILGYTSTYYERH